jgi:hypothetical protein
MKQSSAKIFLSEQRGTIGSDRHTRHCTFNFDSYMNEYKYPFGDLYLFNDEVIAPGSSAMGMDVKVSSYVILIPITGDLLYKGTNGGHLNITIGQILISCLPSGATFQVENPYEKDEINFLQIRIKAKSTSANPFTRLLDFDLKGNQNSLIDLTNNLDTTRRTSKIPFRLSIGQFAGRKEAVYKMNNTRSSLFSFVLAGAFELESRLLHPRDGLALWKTNEIELEALSDNALILTVELL